MQFVYLIILMIAMVEACAQFCLKKGSDNKNKFLLTNKQINFMLLA